jgi:DNA-binding winged helix-turn-helix (wHTH) protein
MSVIAIHPRTPSPGGSGRTPSRRSRPASASPTLRLTLEVTLADDPLPPQLVHLLDLARDLVDRSAGTVAVTRTVSHPAGPSAVVSSLTGRDDGASSAPAADGSGSTAKAAPVPRTDGGGTPRPGADCGGSDDATSLRVLTGPRVVLRAGRPLPLTRLEFDLLVFLARNPRRVFTRTQLLANVWGYQHAVARTVDVHIRRLRAKVGDGVPLVTTVHGVGYRLSDEARIQLDHDDTAPEAG